MNAASIVDILIESDEDIDPKEMALNLPASDLYTDPDFVDVPRSMDKLGASAAEDNYGDLDDPNDARWTRDAWFYQFSKPPFHVMLDIVPENSYGIHDKRQSFLVKVVVSIDNGSTYTPFGTLHANGTNVRKASWEVKAAIEKADFSRRDTILDLYQSLREIGANNRCAVTIPYEYRRI